MHKQVYIAVKKGNTVVIFFTSGNIHRKLLSLINPAMYLLSNIFASGLSDSRYSTRVMQKCDFFLKKSSKDIFDYVLAFMLTFGKMQNTSPLMCTKFEI